MAHVTYRQLHKTFVKMFQTLFQSSEVQTFILKFTSWFANKAPDWSIDERSQSDVYSLQCYYELWNFAMNFANFETFCEIDCNGVNKPIKCQHSPLDK
jgi:hypothetical protein